MLPIDAAQSTGEARFDNVQTAHCLAVSPIPYSVLLPSQSSNVHRVVHAVGDKWDFLHDLAARTPNNANELMALISPLGSLRSITYNLRRMGHPTRPRSSSNCGR
jgi:hypothetical protein